jgi:hypothetical protein
VSRLLPDTIRAVERGSYIEAKPDGYRVAVEIDEHGTITKRLEIDGDRRPMIELILRLTASRKAQRRDCACPQRSSPQQ